MFLYFLRFSYIFLYFFLNKAFLKRIGTLKKALKKALKRQPQQETTEKAWPAAPTISSIRRPAVSMRSSAGKVIKKFTFADAE